MKLFIVLFIVLNLENVIINAYNFTCSSERNTTLQRNFGPWTKWPNAVVKYELHSSLTAQDIVEVNKAFDVYHKKTCIRFEKRANGEAAYVSIENDPNTCGVANICRTGGYQFARFGGSCRNAGVMIHELGHSLCFGHEQTRADRDNYLDYPCGNPDGKDMGFDLVGLFYDYKSCMHYGCNDCMKPKMADVDTSMCGGDMSVLDAEKFNAFYDCGGCMGYRFRPVSKLTQAEKCDLLPAGNTLSGDEVLYVCRVYQNGDIMPGTGNINNGNCYVAMYQQEHIHTNAEFLTKAKAGSRLVWSQKPSNNVIPSNAVPGGRTRLGEILYIARATIILGGQSTTIVGKVHASRPDVAFMGFNGREELMYSFEFLLCN